MRLGVLRRCDGGEGESADHHESADHRQTGNLAGNQPHLTLSHMPDWHTISEKVAFTGQSCTLTSLRLVNVSRGNVPGARMDCSAAVATSRIQGEQP
jgi:hypothetical protein